jgi:hypothetical protein
MKDNPHDISTYLIAEHGSLKLAFDAAVSGAAKAHAEDDFYSLSVWRDVKRLLREKIESDAA